MPRGDGTGPAGSGPMTGRAAGFCAGNVVAGFSNPVQGRGFGGGYGRNFGGRGGMGRRNWFYPPSAPAWGGYPPYGAAPTAERELEMLKSQSEYFAGALEDVKKRIEELDTGTRTE
jgi:hypothetical protein